MTQKIPKYKQIFIYVITFICILSCIQAIQIPTKNTVSVADTQAKYDYLSSLDVFADTKKEPQIQAVESIKNEVPQPEKAQKPTLSSLGLPTNAEMIISVCHELELDIYQCSYALATARHESNFELIAEKCYGHPEYFDKYEYRKDLGNIYPGDGHKYIGRGYVQITGRTNYTNWSSWLGVDLVSNPDYLLTDSHASAVVLVSGLKHGNFTAKGILADYVNNQKQDYDNARKLINGDTWKNGQTIANYAVEYQNMLISVY
jgi:hypothetical protein